jgi:general secretion pathway protein I
MTSSCDRNAGFSLLEVLIALAIAGLALAAMSDAGGSGLRAAHIAGGYELAVSRAKSHLAALMAEPLPPEHAKEGDDGAGYRWRYAITEAARHPGSGNRPLILYDVEVVVSWRDGDQTRETALHSQRLEQEDD